MVCKDKWIQSVQFWEYSNWSVGKEAPGHLLEKETRHGKRRGQPTGAVIRLGTYNWCLQQHFKIINSTWTWFAT